jgi:hypothetical protein
VIPLYGHLVCAALTWIALVADGVMRRLTPHSFWRALCDDVRIFGLGRVLLWVLLCLFAWPAVWIAWMTEWLEPR